MSATLPAPAATTLGLGAARATLGQPGSWFDAHERVALAAEVRAAGACALCAERKNALSPLSGPAEHSGGGPLDPAAVDAVHRITTDPGRLSETWYQRALASGLGPLEIVEITGVVGVVTLADTLARALGCSERALPAPTSGEATGQQSSGTVIERGWVPMVDPDQAEGDIKAMYEMAQVGPGFVFNVARALTAVPVALRSFFGAFLPNYNTHGDVAPGGLDRVQVELLASSTSAFNDCFY